jgi:hypothetical protein
MQVDVHPDLEADLGSSKATFVKRFREWKAGDEFGSYLFGKDGGYSNPTLDFPDLFLMHVHLVPLYDLDKLAIWEKTFKRKGRKTSNRVLIYAQRSPAAEYLLIAILEEADDAHTIAEMKTSENRNIMLAFAAIANRYIEFGEILAID